MSWSERIPFAGATPEKRIADPLSVRGEPSPEVPDTQPTIQREWARPYGFCTQCGLWMFLSILLMAARQFQSHGWSGHFQRDRARAPGGDRASVANRRQKRTELWRAVAGRRYRGPGHGTCCTAGLPRLPEEGGIYASKVQAGKILEVLAGMFGKKRAGKGKCTRATPGRINLPDRRARRARTVRGLGS
jgi:hypothetical protein